MRWRSTRADPGRPIDWVTPSRWQAAWNDRPVYSLSWSVWTTTPGTWPPSPSPSHHTASAQPAEAASPALTVGRPAMASAISSCTVANPALASAGPRPARCAAHSTGAAAHPGLPAAAAASIPANPLVNMNAWHCSTASSSHNPARASWRHRRASGVPSRAGTSRAPVTGAGPASRSGPGPALVPAGHRHRPPRSSPPGSAETARPRPARR